MASDPRSAWMQSLAVPGPGASPTALQRLDGLARTEGMDLLSAAYIESYTRPADLQRAQAIGEGIRAAMGRAIDRAAWLSSDGKQASRTKLAAMQLAIGKPIEAADFSGLQFDRGNYAANLLSLRRWNRARDMARPAGAAWPWPVSQATPSLGYQPAQNTLLVTAATLQPPAFEARSTASDFGTFGALLAQQMSLAFADYTDADGHALGEREQPLVAQYDAYRAGAGWVNGARMLRQNAADLAAIEIAYDAYTAQGPSDPVSTQEFFRAWAATWARQDDPAALDAAQRVSAFAPARWRVNGPLSNSPAFQSAFACKAGQKMYRPAGEQASIWR
jgi:putative endopeptidase